MMARNHHLLLYRYGDWHKDLAVVVPVVIRLVSKKYSIEMNKWYGADAGSVQSYMGVRFHGMSGEFHHGSFSYESYNRGSYTVKYSIFDDPWYYKVKHLRLKVVYRYHSESVMFTYKPDNRYICIVSISKWEGTYQDEYPHFPPKVCYKQVADFGDPLELAISLVNDVYGKL